MRQRPLRLVDQEGDRFSGFEPGDLTECEAASVVRLALRTLEVRHRVGEKLQDPDHTRSYLRLLLAERKNEVFGCVFLDNRHRVRAVKELFQGTIDGASVHSRVVVQEAMDLNSAAVILFHNHPSGVAEPSQADLRITQRVRDALALVDVRVLDHFVVSAEDSVSFAERNLI